MKQLVTAMALAGNSRIEDLLAGLAARSANDRSDLVANPLGNYGFLPGIDFFSWGAVADPGFEVVRARFARLLPLIWDGRRSRRTSPLWPSP